MNNKGLMIIIVLFVIIIVYSIYNSYINSNNEGYKKITFEEMYKIINKSNSNDYVVLDVRTNEEYNESRIPGSILIPDYEINKAENIISNKEQVIFVYCRSGRRSKGAVLNLIKMGYAKIYDVGGIIDYPYDLEN